MVLNILDYGGRWFFGRFRFFALVVDLLLLARGEPALKVVTHVREQSQLAAGRGEDGRIIHKIITRSCRSRHAPKRTG